MNNTYKKIDMDKYPRKDLYEFYKTFDRPCFNILAKSNAKKLYKFAKRNNYSFFLVTVYAILKAANSVPELKMRIVNGEAVTYDSIDCTTPIMLNGEEFCEVVLPYHDNLSDFMAEADAIIKKTRLTGKASCQENTEDRVLISCVPWFHFEAYTCPELDTKQVMPIITYGKMEKGLIPINLKASHYFVDGLHVGRFFANVDKNFANPKTL